MENLPAEIRHFIFLHCEDLSLLHAWPLLRRDVIHNESVFVKFCTNAFLEAYDASSTTPRWSQVFRLRDSILAQEWFTLDLAKKIEVTFQRSKPEAMNLSSTTFSTVLNRESSARPRFLAAYSTLRGLQKIWSFSSAFCIGGLACRALKISKFAKWN